MHVWYLKHIYGYLHRHTFGDTLINIKDTPIKHLHRPLMVPRIHVTQYCLALHVQAQPGYLHLCTMIGWL